MIVYFSGTGNSRWCAKVLANLLSDECLDLFPYMRDGRALQLSSPTPWVFVCPTYSWQLPRVVVQLLRDGQFSGSREVYFLMTCGSDIGSAAPKNRALCQELGLCCKGTLPVVMPENYIAMFRAPQPEEARQILHRARPVLEQAAAAIRAGQELPAPSAGLLGPLKSGVVNTLFYRFQVKAGPFWATDACISCGKCQTLCPLGNIRLEGGKPVWGSCCTHCMACICGCPVEAIEYGRATRGKTRYWCPADRA